MADPGARRRAPRLWARPPREARPERPPRAGQRHQLQRGAAPAEAAVGGVAAAALQTGHVRPGGAPARGPGLHAGRRSGRWGDRPARHGWRGLGHRPAVGVRHRLAVVRRGGTGAGARPASDVGAGSTFSPSHSRKAPHDSQKSSPSRALCPHWRHTITLSPSHLLLGPLGLARSQPRQDALAGTHRARPLSRPWTTSGARPPATSGAGPRRGVAHLVEAGVGRQVEPLGGGDALPPGGAPARPPAPRPAA